MAVVFEESSSALTSKVGHSCCDSWRCITVFSNREGEPHHLVLKWETDLPSGCRTDHQPSLSEAWRTTRSSSTTSISSGPKSLPGGGDCVTNSLSEAAVWPLHSLGAAQWERPLRNRCPWTRPEEQLWSCSSANSCVKSTGGSSNSTKSTWAGPSSGYFLSRTPTAPVLQIVVLTLLSLDSVLSSFSSRRPSKPACLFRAPGVLPR